MEQELSRITGFLDRAEKETKNDFSSLPPTLGPFSAEAKSWYSPTQGGFNVENKILVQPNPGGLFNVENKILNT